MARDFLYDAYGAEIRFDRRVPDRQAEVGRIRDRWVGQATGEVTPENLARLLRGNARLSSQMALCKRLLRDDHIYACMRNLALAVSRLPWEVLPFDDSKEAAKDAEIVIDFLKGLARMKQLTRYLVFGEFYPLVGAQLMWNREYRLDGWDRINPVRWDWDDETNSLRILTVAEPYHGEELDRRGYAIHSSALEPGDIREAGLWEKVAWLWLFKNFTWPAWVKFAETFGDPYIWAFFQRPEDKDSVFDAVCEMSSNARAAFPAGTEIKLAEAQRYGTTNLYSTLKQAAEDGITKVILGHVLNIDAKSGTGTLAGNAAENVSQANLEAVADGVAESKQDDIIKPFCNWHFGTEQVRAGEIPQFTIRATPQKDEQSKAKVFVSVNEALRPVGRAIDPEQIEDEFEVHTVEIGAEGDGEPPARPSKAKARRRTAAKARKLRTPDDVETITARQVAAAAAEFSERILDIFEDTDSLEEAADMLWASYQTLDQVRLASVLRDQTILTALMGRTEGDDA